jgi:long-subunit acyl-CoA synthetase (AMP-forming)
VETATVAPPSALDAATLCEAFQLTASRRGEQVALRTPGGAVEITYAQYADRVRRIAGGLSALGVGRGDTVALMMVNRPEFHLVDTAAMHLGATPFSIYNTSSPEQIAQVLANATSRVVVCEGRFLGAVQAAGPALVEHIVLVDGGPEAVSLAELERLEEPSFDFEATWRAVRPQDVLTLIYTSGTTGPPKGVQLTHANMVAQARGVSAVLPSRPDGRHVSYLPHAHVADRFFGHYYPSIFYGGTVTSVPDLREVFSVLPEVRPTSWGSVPRLWEKLKAGLEAQGISDPGALQDAEKATIREQIGLDQVDWLVCGAAPIAPEVLEYFRELGLPIRELFGMSELSCCATINPRQDIRIGTVGRAIPGLEVRLADDGELLCRGAIVMAGYRNEPDKTAEAIDPEGWLHSGDIAEIDTDGYVRIIDRKKELIINAAGKNMSPANIELRLKSASPLIGQAICIGDRRPFNVALITLDPDAARAWAIANDSPDPSPSVLCGDPRVQTAVAEAVAEANRHLSRVEQIKRHVVLPVDWQPGGDELTPTMKLRRRPIEAKYAPEIESLYSG